VLGGFGALAPATAAGGAADALADFLTSDISMLDDEFLQAVLQPGMLPSEQPLPGAAAATGFPAAEFLQVQLLRSAVLRCGRCSSSHAFCCPARLLGCPCQCS
jgi:hypothetical protein